MAEPSRGEIWYADLNPTRGHEQAGFRPVLGVSHDIYNSGPSGLVIVVPLTSRRRPIPIHVDIDPSEGGLRVPSQALCDQLRSISVDRLEEKWGTISPDTLEQVTFRLRALLAIP